MAPKPPSEGIHAAPSGRVSVFDGAGIAPRMAYSRGWGYYPSGGAGLVP